jgi:threonine dehydrogenase-like Zn-dependent dehydrogenase
MKAITLHGTGDVRVESVPDPRISDPTDAVVRITTSAVCGSDLHQYHGRVPGIEPGVVMGHEFMGIVEEVGAAVTKVKKGDRVLAPFSISCGQCEWCRMRLPTQCSTTGRAVFGGRFGKQYPGGQAEAIRVPFADYMCEKVPAGMRDEDVFFLGDILSTGYVCAENAGIRPGDTVAVFGAGPVGLLALESAHLFGPSRVFVVDRVDYRLKLAEELGGVPVSLDRGEPAEQLRGLTGGRGPDAVLECVGHETPFAQAIQSVRPGGTVSSVGVYVEQSIGFPAREAFFKDLTLRMGICNARNYITTLMPLIQAGRLRPTRIITHTIPLGDAPKGYAIFDKKEDRAIKVMLKP